MHHHTAPSPAVDPPPRCHHRRCPPPDHHPAPRPARQRTLRQHADAGGRHRGPLFRPGRQRARHRWLRRACFTVRRRASARVYGLPRVASRRGAAESADAHHQQRHHRRQRPRPNAATGRRARRDDALLSVGGAGGRVKMRDGVNVFLFSIFLSRSTVIFVTTARGRSLFVFYGKTAPFSSALESNKGGCGGVARRVLEKKGRASSFFFWKESNPHDSSTKKGVRGGKCDSRSLSLSSLARHVASGVRGWGWCTAGQEKSKVKKIPPQRRTLSCVGTKCAIVFGCRTGWHKKTVG